MKRKFHVSPKSKRGVTASRHLGNPKKRSRMSDVRSSRTVRRKNAVTACQIMQDINQYQPWSGAVDTYNNLLEFGCWDAFVDFLDTEYYDENAGEGVISETSLNDLLWFEPAFCYEAVGLYYDDNTGEVSDEPFDEDDYDNIKSSVDITTDENNILKLQYVGNDSNDRPVYESDDGRLFVDTDPRANRHPNIVTKLYNDFDGEPDTPIKYIKKYDNVKIVFIPKRITW